MESLVILGSYRPAKLNRTSVRREIGEVMERHGLWSPWPIQVHRGDFSRSTRVPHSDGPRQWLMFWANKQPLILQSKDGCIRVYPTAGQIVLCYTGDWLHFSRAVIDEDRYSARVWDVQGH